MKSPQERRFDLIKQVLLNDMTGANPPRFATQRTLFGIKSSTEVLLERVAQEENERIEEKIRQEKQETQDKE